MTYEVRAFFNDLGGGSRAEHIQTAEEKERYENSRTRTGMINWGTRIPFMDGYDDGDPLVESVLSPLTVEADTVGAALEVVFAKMNRDDRENGRDERSLSVGDVCEIDGVRYKVANMGFERVGIIAENLHWLEV